MKWSENIGEVHYHGKEVGMAYLGNKLYWMIPVSGDLSKFTNDSTEKDWWYKNANGEKVSLASFVNRNNKTFKMILPSNMNSLEKIFETNTSLEKIIIDSDNKIDNLKQSFFGCNNLKYVDLSNLDISNADNFYQCFLNCSKLETFKTQDTIFTNLNSELKVGSGFANMFSYCSNLEEIDLSGWSTLPQDNNRYSFSGMFSDCKNLRNVKLPNIKADNINTIFANCPKLEEVDLTPLIDDKSVIVEASNGFKGCSALKKIKVKEWTFISTAITEISRPFEGCTSLTTIEGNIYWNNYSGFEYNVYAYDCPFDNPTAEMILRNIPQMNLSGTRYVYFSEYTYNNLTKEQIKVATDKGWTVTYK